MQNLECFRSDIAKSNEHIQNHESSPWSTDAADGHEKIDVSPKKMASPARNVEFSATVERTPPNKNVMPSMEQDAHHHLNGNSLVDNSFRVKAELSKQTDNQTVSPRQRFIQLSNGNRPPQAKAPGVNGLVVNVIPNDSEVYITHVKNQSWVYIRSTATNDEFQKLIIAVDTASKSEPKLKNYPSREDIVMAPFEGVYYRAMVIRSDKDAGTVRVAYFDFGNSEVVAFSSLRELPMELRE